MLKPPALSLYVHIPWCVQKCPYCDFNSHALKDNIPEDAYIDALLEDLDTDIAKYRLNDAPRPLHSIFIGGGTPSLISADGIGRLLQGIEARIPFKTGIEITMEANPSSVEATRFHGYRTAGVNRVSLGVQSLRPGPLAELGRRHSVEEAVAAVRIAQSVFERSSFDLIYARPRQTLEDWEDELKEALWMAQGHISLYQLTIEQGTRYFDLQAAGKLTIPGEDLAADFYELTQELTAAAGLPAYEISNHARPGQESEHNMLYWRYGEYAGIGPGAHGRLMINNQRHATADEKMPFDWQKNVMTKGHGMVVDDVLTWEEQGDEFLVMGLRLKEGISPARFTALSGRQINPNQIAALKGYGFVETLPNGNLRVTDRGWPVLDAVVADLAA